MIYVESLNLLFLELPKNATTSMRKLLVEELDGVDVEAEQLAGAPGWSSGRWSHGTEIPKELAGATIVATVRDPVSRFFSMWDHFCNRHASAFGMTDVGMDSFAEWLNHSRPGYVFPTCGHSEWHDRQRLAFRSQREVLVRQPVDVLVRVEALRDDLVRAGIPRSTSEKLERLNRGVHGKERRLSKAGHIHVDAWAEGDYRLWSLAALGRPWRP